MTTMSAIETDLDNDGGLPSEAYLDALVDRGPSVNSLLNEIVAFWSSESCHL